MGTSFKFVSIAALVATTVAGTAAQGRQVMPVVPPTPSAPAESAPAPTGQGGQGGTFRSAVDLVSIAAVVRDKKGRFVSNLAQTDFIVTEGGEPRPIVGFRAEEDGPVRLAIVFDVSGSMRVGSKVIDAREAARQVLNGLGKGDQAALFAFDTRLACLKAFTSDFGSILNALDQADPPYGQTSLYDAVAETARSVAAERMGDGARGPQRAAVVVLTDGVDTHSRLTPEQVSGIASGIDVPVYVMAVMASIDDPAMFDNAAAGSGGLRDLAQWTGGDLFTMSTPTQSSLAARQIVGELRHQYLLAFEASARGGWRSLEVKSRSRDHVVRARSGYTAGGRGGLEGATGPSQGSVR